MLRQKSQINSQMRQNCYLTGQRSTIIVWDIILHLRRHKACISLEEKHEKSINPYCHNC
jgi:hypothetical protein